MNRTLIAFAGTLLTFVSVYAETVVDFEELSVFNGTPPSTIGQYYNGYGAGATSDGFQSQDVTFSTLEFGPGFSYSNAIDSSTPGFFNQFAAHPGGGSDGAGGVAVGTNYGMVNTGSLTQADGTPVQGANLTFSGKVALGAIDVANATYAAQYMLNGTDGFGTPDRDPNALFGDGDFLRLILDGFDGDDGMGNSTGRIEFDLANYGGPGTADDVFLDGWQTLDLSGFGETKSLRFSLTSSQINQFLSSPPLYGSDVPAYLAIDNLRYSVTAIPEPTAFGFLTLVGGVFTLRRRRRQGQIQRPPTAAPIKT